MIFTIGYSNRTIAEFSREIERRSITQIVDVRSSPWSRNPHFTRDRLYRWAEASGRMYRWEGNVLGGRSIFAPDSAQFRIALDALIAASSNERMVLLCAEGDPEHCHRCCDIGAALLAFCEVPTVNIRRDGTDEGIRDTLRRVRVSAMHPSLRDVAFPSGIGSLGNARKS